MAQVPTYGGPKETLRPIGAAAQEFHDPGRDMLNVPAALKRGFNSLGDAADKIAARFDEARVLDVETQMRQYVVEQTYGDNGYTSLKGSEATAPDDQGRGLAERGLNGFDEKLSMLTRDMKLTTRQQALARKQVAAIRGGFYNNMSAYAFREAQNYESETLSGGISQSQSAAFGDFAKPAAMAESVDHIEQLVDRQAKLNGWPKEYTAQKKLEESSKYFMNAMEGALTAAERDPRAAYYARDILKANRDKITGEVAAQMNARINTVLDNYTVDVNVQKWRATSPSGGNVAYKAATGVVLGSQGADAKKAPVNGSAAYEAAKGETQFAPDGAVRTDVRSYDATGTGLSGVSANAAKAAAEKRGQVWDANAFANDPAYNNAMGALVMDDCVQKAAGDLTQAYALYYSDEKTVQKAMEKAAKSGQPESWISELPPVVAERTMNAKRAYDKKMSGHVTVNGREVSAYEPGYAAASRTWRTRREAERFVLANNGRARVDPKYRDQLVDRLMLEEARSKQDYETEQANRLAKVTDLLVQNGGDFSKVPSELWSKLTYAEQSSVRSTIKRVVIGVKEPDWNVLAEYKLHPDRLAALTDDQFQNLSVAFFGNKADEMALLRATTKQTIAANADATAQGKRLADSGTILTKYGPSDDTLTKAVKALDPKFDPTAKGNARRLMWLSELFAEKVQRGELSPDTVKTTAGLYHELEKIWARDLYTGGGDFKFNAFDVKVSDLPNRGRADAYRVISALTKSRLSLTREPDDRELDQTLFMLMNMRAPNFNLGSAEAPTLDEKVVEAACKDLGVKPDTRSIEVYRQYVIRRLYGLTTASEDLAVRLLDQPMANFNSDF